MPGLFIAGAGTDVGKTYVTAGLIRALRADGRPVAALKPVVSGFDPKDWSRSDPGVLLDALGQGGDPAALEAMSPWRYKAPLAPDMAAAREGRAVDYPAIRDLCRQKLAEADETLLLIEGAGGVMSPIDPMTTNLDLMADIGAPVLLVAGSYLGTISHTLTALTTLRVRGVEVRAVVVSETTPEGPPFAETLAAIARLGGGVAVIGARRGTQDWTAAALDRIDAQD